MFQGIGAGFDGARVGNRCMLAETGHMPNRLMAAHYHIAAAHGVTWVRDALPPEHDPLARMKVAAQFGLPVVWTLTHYWEHPDPEAHAARVAAAHNALHPDAPLWVCLVAEPLWHPVMRQGEHGGFLRDLAERMLRVLRASVYDVKVMTRDPAHSLHDVRHHGLADLADVIGLDIYAHDVTTAPINLIFEANWLFKKPIVIAETGLHNGHPRRWQGIDGKGEWLRYMLDQCRYARSEGARIGGICWTPFVNTPSWNHGETHRWDHGLIREDLSVDPSLSAAIMKATGVERRVAA